MRIDIITLFPKMFEGPFSESMISRAQKRDLVKIRIHQLRDWAINKGGQVDPVKSPTSRGAKQFLRVDDKPYGGGAGMVMRVDTAFSALRNVCGSKNIGSQKNKRIVSLSHCLIVGDRKKISGRDNNEAMKQCSNKPYIILPTPSGKKFDQALARKLSKKKHLVFLCPHYEGYDHRIESLVDKKISIGDYVLTGGELPAAVIVDAVVRLVPGVIKAESLKEESFSSVSGGRTLRRSGATGKGPTSAEVVKYEYPQYTRPEVFEATIKGKKIKKRVPKVLLSGNHALIKKWRTSKSKQKPGGGPGSG